MALLLNIAGPDNYCPVLIVYMYFNINGLTK